MENTAHAHLHRATLRTLHSHNFTSSSSIASHTLTTLYASYLDLLARACAARAQHAGRTGVGWADAVGALEEVGVTIEELDGWGRTEAGEVGRKYVVAAKDKDFYGLDRDKEKAKAGDGGKGRGVLGVSSWHANGVGVSVGPGVEEARRKELVEVDEYVSEGLVRDPSSWIPLVYAQLPSPVQSDDEDEQDDSRPYDVYAPDMDSKPNGDANGIALPPSPVSRSPSPKRARTDRWATSPPDHVPDFLPPFPSITTPPPVSAPAQTSPVKSRHKSVPSISASGAIPYVRSALANVSPASLPPINPPNALPPIQANTGVGTVASPSVALREAMAQYTSEPTAPFPFSTNISATGAAGGSAARSRAARVLASALTQAFDASDSLFGAWGGVETSSVGGHGEGVPVFLDAQGEMMTGKKSLDKVGPLAISGVGGRVVPREEDIGSVMGYLNSSILPLARTFLAPSVLHKTTRIIPPQPLRDSADADKAQPMYYHPERAVLAPWCVPVPEADGGGGASGDTANALPEAKLVPTWDWPDKDYESALVVRRGRGIVGGVAVGNQGRAESVAGA